jgi:hypothetical protein
MIPGKIVRFLEQYANVGVAGIRDANLVPAGCRVSGWHLHSNGQTITLLIPPPATDRLIAALEDNGHIAVTVGENQTHETYQLKGRYLTHRTIEPGDAPFVARVRERYLRAIRSEIPEGIPEAYVMAVAVPDPAVAVDVDISEVYVQTPGPGAGSRLYPPVEPPAHDQPGATPASR